MGFYGLIRALRISAREKMEGLTTLQDVEERRRMGEEVQVRTMRATVAGPLKGKGPMEGAWRTTRGTRRKEGWLEYKGLRQPQLRSDGIWGVCLHLTLSGCIRYSTTALPMRPSSTGQFNFFFVTHTTHYANNGSKCEMSLFKKLRYLPKDVFYSLAVTASPPYATTNHV